ncbi:uncharacterized protein L969DRAFT_625086 [Mixia osmundae IAM 14324]|uniref:Uncharacterized protein n=1 Tax=Mixia osmundae (strain CBS 9802 / IAM 14324 / JCM 22182 / KY 12970) TaxID=764103 RepID=G7E733_MIXOS|nr:uncharacterized protein L969DRAFT_625086 [Mixia osmundae IAM 14324]KEI38974.1 hypothetical protein L969DRAFT_625086 [Mixia osmundae IAM 14324]GAA98643.1 hypothetical protein E5Q_05330 [Mixia osmundae IAM 14324]
MASCDGPEREMPSGDLLAKRLMEDCCRVVMRRQFEVRLIKAESARLRSETFLMICDPRNALSAHCGLLFSERTTWSLRDCETIDSSCQIEFGALTRGKKCRWSDGTVDRRPAPVPDVCDDAPQ